MAATAGVGEVVPVVPDKLYNIEDNLSSGVGVVGDASPLLARSRSSSRSSSGTDRRTSNISGSGSIAAAAGAEQQNVVPSSRSAPPEVEGPAEGAADLNDTSNSSSSEQQS